MKTKRTTFPEWIREYGQANLARAIGVDAAAVQRWKDGKTQPSTTHAVTILKLAKGALRPDDLLVQKGGAR